LNSMRLMRDPASNRAANSKTDPAAAASLQTTYLRSTP